MKIKSVIYSLLLVGLLISLLLNCKKETFNVPTVTLAEVTNITSTTAMSGGEIISNGGVTVALRGVCWSSTDTLPTIVDTKTNDGIGSGTFVSTLTGLTPGTTYTIRAYAINSAGRAYSATAKFSTVVLATALTTTEISAVTSSTATGGGHISNDGGSPVTARGVCWSTSQNPTIVDSKTINGTGSGSFICNLTGLEANTTYYLRAYATNTLGTSYGNEVSFKTLESLNQTVTEL
jgi:hypothetical protein